MPSLAVGSMATSSAGRLFGCTRRLGAAGDSSDLRAGVAGAVTSTPPSHRCRPDRGKRLTPRPSPVPAGDPDSPGVLHSARLPFRHSPGRGYEPPAHSVTARGAACGKCDASGPSSLPSLTEPCVTAPGPDIREECSADACLCGLFQSEYFADIMIMIPAPSLEL